MDTMKNLLILAVLIGGMLACSSDSNTGQTKEEEEKTEYFDPTVKGLEVIVTTAEGMESWVGSGSFLLQNLQPAETIFSIKQVRLSYRGEESVLDSFYVYPIPGGGEINPSAIVVPANDSLEISVTFAARPAVADARAPSYLECSFGIGEKVMDARSDISVEVEKPESF